MIEIDDLIGKPWVRNGRGPDGYDCYGLVIEIERRLGHTWIRIEDCEKLGYDFSDCLEQWKRAVSIKEIPMPEKVGDICILKDGNGAVAHVGVYIDRNQIIHCDRRGVHIDRVTRMYGRIVKVYTWLEEKNGDNQHI